MIGGARFAFARARAAVPALATLAVVAAIAAALIVGMAAASRALEAREAQAALAAASGQRASVTASVEGDLATLHAAIARELDARGLADLVEVAVADGVVTVTPDPVRITGESTAALADAIDDLADAVRDEVGTRVQMGGGLGYTLETILDGLQTRRGPVAVAIGLLALSTAVVVGAVALEPVRSRLGESLLLRARGARTRSLVGLTAVETAVVTTVGAVIGAGLATVVAHALAVPTAGWLFAGLTVVLIALAATVTTAIVVARTSDRRAGRADVAVFAGAAVVLAVVTGLAAWRFAEAGTPVIAGSQLIDPLVAIAPALVLALIAIIAVLLATPLARLVAALLSSGRAVAPVTPLRLASRRPARHALPIAVVAFAVGSTTVAGAYVGTVTALGDAPEALRVGADVRVTTIPETIDARQIIDAAGESADAAMTARVFTALGGEGRIPVIAAEAAQFGEIVLDAGGTFDPAGVGAALRLDGDGIALPGDEVTFTLSTPLPEVQEWEGETWQPDPTAANIGFTFLSAGGDLWFTSFTNGETIDQEAEDGSIIGRTEVAPDFSASIELPEGTWALAAVDVWFAGGAFGDGLTLHDVSSGGEPIDLAALSVAPGSAGQFALTDDGAFFVPELVGDDHPKTRAIAPGLPEQTPVVLTDDLAASLGLSVGDAIALEFDNPDFDAEVIVVDTIPVLPGSATGQGLLADIGALSLAAQTQIVPNQVWFASDAPQDVAAAVADQFNGPTVLVADTRSGTNAAATAWAFVLAAAGVGALAVVVLVLRRTRTRADAQELALLAVLGLGRARAARLRAHEDVFALMIGVVAGLIAGAVTAWLVSPPLVRAAYGTVPEAYPVPLVWPWAALAAALVVLVATFAVVVVSVRAPRTLAALLREDE